MRIHGFFILGLTALVALSTAMGYFMPVMFMLPVAVAYLWIRERHLYAFLLSSVFGLLPLLTARDAFMAVAFLFAAFSGIGLGLLMRRKASLGMGIAFVTVCLFLLNAGHSALFWQEYRAAWQSEMQAFSASVSEVKDAERTAPMLEALDWLAQHWLYLSFGMLFGFILLVSTVLVSALYRKAAQEGLASPANVYFSRMRVPELLVWAAIVLAGLWFLDSWRPNDVIRFIAWNGAVAMAVVYWLNGLAILVFALQAFQVRPLVAALVFSALFMLNLQQLLAFVGLFDTWWDLRFKIRRFIETRQRNA